MKNFSIVIKQINIQQTNYNAKKRKQLFHPYPLKQVLTHNPQDINNIFHNFYNNHYSSKHEPNQSEIDNFLDNLDLPTLPREQANLLDTPLTPEELYTALNKMPNTK